ncbi:MAG: sortase, partial [Clostridiales bacterium]|nr:sortase [Clostridiales bacterium]
TLENYVGHVVGSSLPVGGESTHAVISGHSGMAGQKMFTDLHELKAGDMVYIHVLDEVLAYTVDEVNTVLPGDTSLLGIEQGKDCLTLITCTPVGVNAHRLLVHCSRVPYGQEEQADEEAVPETSTWQRQYFTGIGCGVAALLLVLICHGLISVWRRKHGKGP